MVKQIISPVVFVQFGGDTLRPPEEPRRARQRLPLFFRQYGMRIPPSLGLYAGWL